MWSFLRTCLLEAIGIVATLVAVVSAADEDRLDTQPLVRVAKRHGVPMPPKSARLILAGTGQEPEVYSPAFLLEERADGDVVVLRGFRREVVSKNGRGDPLWRPFDTTPITPQFNRYRVDCHRVSTFICAVQLAVRRDDSKAQFLWKQVGTASQWSDRWVFSYYRESNPVSCL
jgi:hypothetical protein